MRKCTCGHITKDRWEFENEGLSKEEAKTKDIQQDIFIPLKGCFFLEVDTFYHNTKEVSLHVCPKCGTVICFDH